MQTTPSITFDERARRSVSGGFRNSVLFHSAATSSVHGDGEVKLNHQLFPDMQTPGAEVFSVTMNERVRNCAEGISHVFNFDNLSMTIASDYQPH